MIQRQKPSVVLIGDGPTALAALRSLVECCRVVHVVRSDAAADPVRKLAAAQDIPVSDLRGLEQIAKLIGDLRPEAVVISSFSRIIPPKILALSRFINVHYSLLPRYRGRANVNWAIINGESAVGISIHLVAPGLDNGNLLFQQPIAVAPDDTVTSIYELLNAIQEQELGNAVIRAISGDHGAPQNSCGPTYGCARVPDDGEIDWRLPAETIDRFIRGLAPPFPGAFTFLDMQRLVIVRATPVHDAPTYEGRIPGRIVGRSRSEGWVDVLAGEGVLRLLSIAREGGEPCAPASIIGSTRMTLGLSRVDLLRKVTALEERIVALERSNTS